MSYHNSFHSQIQLTIKHYNSVNTSPASQELKIHNPQTQSEKSSEQYSDIIPFLIENVALLMQNTKRVFCHILLDCAVPRFISKKSVMREKLIEMVLYCDEKFQQCLQGEGLDSLSYIQKCINDGMKESLGEKKLVGKKKGRYPKWIPAYQLSVISYQLSVISVQFFTVPSRFQKHHKKFPTHHPTCCH